MKRPRIYRKKCRTCGAAFSSPKLAKVERLLASHDCRAEQLKRERAVATKKILDSMLQGAMLGMLGHALSNGIGPITGPDEQGIYHALPKGAILPPPVPGAKRTKNPLFRHHPKSRVSPVDKGRPKPPSE